MLLTYWRLLALSFCFLSIFWKIQATWLGLKFGIIRKISSISRYIVVLHYHQWVRMVIIRSLLKMMHFVEKQRYEVSVTFVNFLFQFVNIKKSLYLTETKAVRLRSWQKLVHLLERNNYCFVSSSSFNLSMCKNYSPHDWNKRQILVLSELGLTLKLSSNSRNCQLLALYLGVANSTL